jgi:hypothetical protein
MWKPNQPGTHSEVAEQTFEESIGPRLARLREHSLKIRGAIPCPELLDDWDTDILTIIVTTCHPIGSLSSANIVLWMGFAIDERSFDDARKQMYSAWENLPNREAVVIPRMLIRAEQKYHRADLSTSLCEFFETVVRLSISVEANDESTINRAVLSFRTALNLFTLRSIAERLSRSDATSTDSHVEGANTPRTDPYALLGVLQGCSQSELKAAYLQKVKQWHPDQIQHMAPELRTFADQQLGLINAAYDALRAGA